MGFSDDDWGKDFDMFYDKNDWVSKEKKIFKNSSSKINSNNIMNINSLENRNDKSDEIKEFINSFEKEKDGYLSG